MIAKYQYGATRGYQWIIMKPQQGSSKAGPLLTRVFMTGYFSLGRHLV